MAPVLILAGLDFPTQLLSGRTGLFPRSTVIRCDSRTDEKSRPASGSPSATSPRFELATHHQRSVKASDSSGPQFSHVGCVFIFTASLWLRGTLRRSLAAALHHPRHTFGRESFMWVCPAAWMSRSGYGNDGCNFDYFRAAVGRLCRPSACSSRTRGRGSVTYCAYVEFEARIEMVTG